MDDNTPWVITVKTEQRLVNNSWDMYPALVYYGSFSLLAMYGDGDPDITEPGSAKVECQVTKLTADAIRATLNAPDIPIFQIFRDEAL